eukprot:6156025-Pyramimonas_sp.AAC.1
MGLIGGGEDLRGSLRPRRQRTREAQFWADPHTQPKTGFRRPRSTSGSSAASETGTRKALVLSPTRRWQSAAPLKALKAAAD